MCSPPLQICRFRGSQTWICRHKRSHSLRRLAATLNLWNDQLNLDFPTGLLCPDFWCGWVTPTTVQHLLLGLAQWAIDWDLALRPVKQMLYCLSSRVWSVARVRTWVQLALQIVTHPQLYGDASHRLQVVIWGNFFVNLSSPKCSDVIQLSMTISMSWLHSDTQLALPRERRKCLRSILVQGEMTCCLRNIGNQKHPQFVSWT